MIDIILFCLASNIYFEARSEPLPGQYAVAEVTIRRADLSGRNICQEVFLDRQFSWTHEIERPKVINNKAWLEAMEVASVSIHGKTNFSNGATHYHALKWKGKPFPKPKWAYKLCKAVTIGNHVFYKPCSIPMMVTR